MSDDPYIKSTETRSFSGGADERINLRTSGRFGTGSAQIAFAKSLDEVQADMVPNPTTGNGTIVYAVSLFVAFSVIAAMSGAFILIPAIAVVCLIGSVTTGLSSDSGKKSD